MDIDRNLLIEALRRIYEKNGADVFLNQRLLVSMLKDVLSKAGSGNDELAFFRKIVDGTIVGYQITEGLNKPAEIQHVQQLISGALKGNPLYQKEEAAKFTLGILCEAFSWPLFEEMPTPPPHPGGEYLNPKIEFIKRLDTSKPLKVRFTKWDDSFFNALSRFAELEVTVDSATSLSKISDLITLVSLAVNEYDGDFDFISLAKLINLKRLSFVAKSEFINSYSESENISVLGTLSALTDLKIHHLHMTDLSHLSKLHHLKNLSLNGCGISSVNFLKNIVTLETVDVKWNKISDISCLSELPLLREFECSHNNVSSTFELPSKSLSLEILGISYNSLSNSDLYSGYGDSKNGVFTTTNFPKLTHLNLQGNDVTEWKHCCEICNVGGRDFVVFGGKQYATDITTLKLSDGSVHNHSTSALKHLAELTELAITHDSISDVSFVAALAKLKRLDISDNAIEDLTPLNALVEGCLEYLNVTNNPIRVIGKARKVAAAVGLPSTGTLRLRKFKWFVTSFDSDSLTLPNILLWSAFIGGFVGVVAFIMSFFTANPVKIENIAVVTSSTHAFLWYNWIALLVVPIIGAIALIYFVWSLVEDWGYGIEIPRTVISGVIVAGCVAGFLFGGLFPHNAVEYNQIEIFGGKIDKAENVAKLSEKDIANIENYIYTNIGKIQSEYSASPANQIKAYQVIWLAVAILTFMFTIVLLVGTIRDKKALSILGCAVLSALSIVLVLFANNNNFTRNGINTLAQSISGRKIISELYIRSNVLIGQTGEAENLGYWEKPDGTLYIGEFVVGSITGKGVYISADKIKYVGTFMVGKLYGETQVYAPNGELVYTGDFRGDDPTVAIYDKVSALYDSGNYADFYKIVDVLAGDEVPRGLNFLAWLYSDGNYFEQDYKRAFELFSKVADSGEPRGFYNLANMYYSGKYVEQDQAKAVELWKKSADIGLALAQRVYAWANYNGYGIEKNVKEAIKYYGKASSEDTASMYELGIIYVFGLGADTKIDKGIRLLNHAKEKGNEEATAFLTSYEANKELIETQNKYVKKPSYEAKLLAYESLHVALQSNSSDNATNIETSVGDFVSTTGGLLNSSVARTAEYLLLLSLVEYLNSEAPTDEQNLYMLLECLYAGKDEAGISSNLDRLVDMLRDRKPEHDVLKHYDDYKALVGSFAFNDVLDSCIQRLDSVDVVKSPWYTDSEKAEMQIDNDKNIPIAARMLLLSFGTETEQGYQSDMETLLQAIYAYNVSNSAPILLSDLDSYNPSTKIKGALDNLIKFYSDFQPREEDEQ